MRKISARRLSLILLASLIAACAPLAASGAPPQTQASLDEPRSPVSANEVSAYMKMLAPEVNAVGAAYGPLKATKPQTPNSNDFSQSLASLGVPFLSASLSTEVCTHIRVVVSGSVARPFMAPQWGWNADWCCVVALDVDDLAELNKLAWKATNGSRYGSKLFVRHLKPSVYLCASTAAILESMSKGGGPSAALLHPSHVNTRARSWGASILGGFNGYFIDDERRITVIHETPSSGGYRGFSGLPWPVIVRELNSYGEEAGAARWGVKPFVVDVKESSDRRLEFTVPLNFATGINLLYRLGPSFGLYVCPL